MDKPRIWTSKETADFLGISENALRIHRSRGTSPPYIKIGSAVRYVPRDVAAWLEDNTHTTTRPSKHIGLVT